MTPLRLLLAAALLTLASAWLIAQPTAEARKPPSFPDTWAGTWKGPAKLVVPGRDDHEFLMELVVAPTDDPARYQWTIVYAEQSGARQERKYELLVRDASKGLYAVDEKSGIIIPSVLLDGALYSSFEVQGTRVNTRMKLEAAGTDEQHISVEMVSGSAQNAESSGGKDGVPEVLSLVPRSLQQATLMRSSEPDAVP